MNTFMILVVAIKDSLERPQKAGYEQAKAEAKPCSKKEYYPNT